MALPAQLPHPSGPSADPRTPERTASALGIALDRRHPSCDDMLVTGTCRALANCPLAPACTPPDAPAPTPSLAAVPSSAPAPTLAAVPTPTQAPASDTPPTLAAVPTPSQAFASDPAPTLAAVPTLTPAPILAAVPTPTTAPAVAGPRAATPAVAPVPASPARAPRRLRAVVRFGRRDDRGQATAEYGLVILVAGLIALGVIAWARGTGSFTDLFESVIDSLTAGL